MDAALDVPHGPHRCQKNGTVTVPQRLLREVGVEPGEDEVHWMLNPDLPGTLLLVPSAMVARAVPKLVDELRRVSR